MAVGTKVGRKWKLEEGFRVEEGKQNDVERMRERERESEENQWEIYVKGWTIFWYQW